MGDTVEVKAGEGGAILTPTKKKVKDTTRLKYQHKQNCRKLSIRSPDFARMLRGSS